MSDLIDLDFRRQLSPVDAIDKPIMVHSTPTGRALLAVILAVSAAHKEAETP